MKRSSTRARLTAWISSPLFFRIILGFMVFQALWIALTAKYPMAFDEDFHFGLIKLYANHLSPFWTTHPAGGEVFGAVTRDPSYFYHYLMSFVLRFLRLFTSDQTIQIIILRLLNISLFTTGLVLFRRLLLRTGASRAITHACLALFVLVPVVPLLAAEINYDNLFIPITALSLLLADSFVSKLRRKDFDSAGLLKVLTVCFFGSIVKYAFLPIFAAIVLYIIITAVRAYGFNWRIIFDAATSFNKLRRVSQVLLIVGLVLFGGLFMQREGINIIRYHNPAPDCADVLTVTQCTAYGPWNRDYYLALNKAPHAAHSPIGFTKVWVDGMWLRSYFTLAGPTEDYQTRGPLTVPAQSAIIFAVVGGIVSVLYGYRVLRRYNAPLLELLLYASAFYLLSLWINVYQLFLHAGVAVAINGRYLLVIWPLLLVFIALASNEALAKLPKLKPYFLAIVFVCALWGGGVMTYMIRSSDNWYWPGSMPQSLNHAAQKVLKPITPGSANPTQYLP